MFPSRPDLLDGVPARDARPADRHGPDAGVREPGPSRPDGNDPLDPVRMTADALARSPAFLLSVIDSFPDPIFVKDEQHRWLLLNDACVAMMGRPREELIGLSDHDLHPREQADASWERDELVLETGEPFVAREQIDWGGESRTVLTTKHRHRDAIHGRRYVVGSIKDLSPHLAMERALAESAASLGLTLEHSPLGIGTIDPGGRILTVNEAGCEFFGYREDELLGRSYLDLVHPVDLPACLRGIDQLVRGEQDVSHVEARFRRRDGETRIGIARGGAVHDEDGQPRFLVVVLEDVTAARLAERERDLLERQLRHAQKLESLGTMAGGIAHDFNNLLMSVLGHADLARTEIEDGVDPLRSLDQIRAAAERAASLCKQLLAFAGRGRLETRPVDPSRLIHDIAGLLKLSSRQARLKLDLAPGLPAVAGDPQQLRQVVVDLVRNAAEAIGDGPGSITVRAGVVDCTRADLKGLHVRDELEPGRHISIRVEDTGCGLAPEEISRIFDPFYTTKFTGRGLGLAAVLGIVRGHRGAIRVDSDPGAGTTIEVLLPCGGREEEGEAAAPESARALAGGAGTILVVDDDPAVLDIAGHLLRKLGFTALLAADGAEACALYREEGERIALVILDMTMPGLDGAATSEELRRIDPGVRILLSSGFSEETATARIPADGVAGFLQKPYTLTGLQAVLDRILDG